MNSLNDSFINVSLLYLAHDDDLDEDDESKNVIYM